VRVLLVEPEAPLLRILERGLRAHGYEVVAVEGGDQAATLVGDAALRCLVLDTSASGADGAAIRERLRRLRPDLPTILLTARDRSGGDGTDDRLAKPFALEELIGRIHALTRGANERRPTTLVAGDLRLDLLARCAWRGDRFVDLPGREFALLEYFVRHADRVLSRRSILADVWGYDLDPRSNSNVVDVYVRYLRAKVDQPGQRSLITTVRGAGYRFDPHAEPIASRQGQEDLLQAPVGQAGLRPQLGQAPAADQPAG
jgi:two-component system, OmpR family, response regulator